MARAQRIWSIRTYCASVLKICQRHSLSSCSVSSLVVLGLVTGVDGIGVSQSMNLIWHQPARLCVYRLSLIYGLPLNKLTYRGDKLRIVATSIFIHGRVRSARCEVCIYSFVPTLIYHIPTVLEGRSIMRIGRSFNCQPMASKNDTRETMNIVGHPSLLS
jgi:hypothetical protein